MRVWVMITSQEPLTLTISREPIPGAREISTSAAVVRRWEHAEREYKRMQQEIGDGRRKVSVRPYWNDGDSPSGAEVRR
jgi:hypothetical protein